MGLLGRTTCCIVFTEVTSNNSGGCTSSLQNKSLFFIQISVFKTKLPVFKHKLCSNNKTEVSKTNLQFRKQNHHFENKTTVLNTKLQLRKRNFLQSKTPFRKEPFFQTRLSQETCLRNLVFSTNIFLKSLTTELCSEQIPLKQTFCCYNKFSMLCNDPNQIFKKHLQSFKSERKTPFEACSCLPSQTCLRICVRSHSLICKRRGPPVFLLRFLRD